MKMEAFTRWEGVAAPMMRPNIDTDAIIPSREMKRVSKLGLGEGMFADERYVATGSRELNPDFVLNKLDYAGTSIILAGNNFGCGSSREHAVWALKDYGIRAVIAPDFGAIFANNCVRNGVLAAPLAQDRVEAIAAWVAEDPQTNQVVIDLEAQEIQAGELREAFSIADGARRMLLEGLDAIALTQQHSAAIAAFEQRRQESRPWLYRRS